MERSRRSPYPRAVSATSDPVGNDRNEAAPARPETRVARWGPGALSVVPALIVVVGAWSHRWVEEDAFINLRVVDHILAGHGPVFNAGERVEAFTSPLWIAALVIVRVTLGLVVRMEWATVLAALTTATIAFAIGGRAARLVHPGRLAFPLGLTLIAGVAVVWDFATSGLEVGLSWAWLAGCWLVLVRAASGQKPPVGRACWSAPLLLGLGPLVRPDLGLIAVCLLVAWLVIVRPPGRHITVAVAAFAALPVAYQVFRMGYFVALVPSTALAKSAGEQRAGQGVDYAWDLVEPYWLWVPLLVIGVAVAANTTRSRSLAAATIGMLAGASLHAGYFVYIGGDYMHGRLLLPALFALALPASVGLRRGDARTTALVAVGVAWLVPCATLLRYERDLPAAGFQPPPISDRRMAILDMGAVVRERGGGAVVERAWERGERGLIPLVVALNGRGEAVPASDDDRLVVVAPTIGIYAYQAGTDVHVIDLGGLAEPLSARAPPRPGFTVPGHRKIIAPEWYDGRFGARRPDADEAKVAAAGRALECAPLRDLLEAITEPVTPGRFASNLRRSLRFTRLEVAREPVEAVRQLCPR
ncbi:beta-(1-_2)-arabinofuranosyltransferase [soil metagenome]